jgi:uncharacterized protein YabN with tetrapyrrole methylase and pyrophosphatase domain
MSKEITIYIIGTGQNPKDHMTLESVRVCKNVEKLLLINGDSQSVIEAIDGHSNYEDIIDLYIDGDIDDNNYKRIVEKVISDSKKYNSVAVTTAGHPLVGVSWWERLKKNKHFTGNLKYVEGISSWTSMLVELELDPLEAGSIIIDANRCLVFNQEINPEFDIFIFNFCSTGTRYTNISDPSKDNELNDLKIHFLKFFPKNHKVKMISAKHNEQMDGEIYEVELQNLCDLLPKIKFYSSLFFPSINPRKINKNFLKKLIGIKE